MYVTIWAQFALQLGALKYDRRDAILVAISLLSMHLTIYYDGLHPACDAK